MPQCMCGDIECIDTRFDNPEPELPSEQDWEEINHNIQLNEGDVPLLTGMKSWNQYEYGDQIL